MLYFLRTEAYRTNCFAHGQHGLHLCPIRAKVEAALRAETRTQNMIDFCFSRKKRRKVGSEVLAAASAFAFAWIQELWDKRVLSKTRRKKKSNDGCPAVVSNGNPVIDVLVSWKLNCVRGRKDEPFVVVFMRDAHFSSYAFLVPLQQEWS